MQKINGKNTTGTHKTVHLCFVGSFNNAWLKLHLVHKDDIVTGDATEQIKHFFILLINFKPVTQTNYLNQSPSVLTKPIQF